MVRTPKRNKSYEGSHNHEASSASNKNKRIFCTGMVLAFLIAFCWEDLLLMAPKPSFNNNNQQPQAILSQQVYHIPNHQLRDSIRKWGCDRTETPFIFVHIGKAGGGSARARIAASALNYTKGARGADGSYYPISKTDKARFCNSCFSNRRPSDEKSYEGTLWCHATTPIGRAIACPELWSRVADTTAGQRMGECDPLADDCRLVYSGHNWVGAEFHWLPFRYLDRWWEGLQLRPMPWHRLDPDQIWCDAQKVARPTAEYKPFYEPCSIPLARQVDALASVAISPNDGLVESWAPLYAALPVLRVTILREPFAWIMSKFFWHHQHAYAKCDNITQAIGWPPTGGPLYDVPRQQEFKHNTAKQQEVKLKTGGPGWLAPYCLTYIMFLCGEDCATRYVSGRANLADLERQAEENLRHSFAVVGILEDMDDFYSMVHARVSYIDTTLNMDLGLGPKHQSSNTEEASRCKERFKDTDFQKEVLEKSPELQVVHRLYQVGREVKQFQKDELQRCSPSSFPSGR